MMQMDGKAVTHAEVMALQHPLDLDRVEPDNAALLLIPAAFVHRHGVFPLSFDLKTKEVIVATDRPWMSDRPKPTHPDLKLAHKLATSESLLRAIRSKFGMPEQFGSKTVQ